MSQAPTPYTRQNNFVTDAGNPNLVLGDIATDLDAEYEAIKTSLNQTISRLNELQRDDGQLRDDIISVAEGSIATGSLEDSAVTTAKLSDGAITTAKLADASVSSSKVIDGAVTLSKLADGAVTLSKLADGAVGSSLAIATGSTTARSLANRFADPVNIKDFGAIGNNIADDTAAIQAAIDYAFSIGSSIYFPSGNFRTLSGIVLKCGCTCNTGAIITAGALINTVTIPAGNYTATSAFYLPQIVGGANGLVLDGASFATIHFSNIALAANGLVLQISDTNKVCADNNINFNTINGCSGAGIKFNHLATTISGTLFQGNIIKGNFILNVKYGIHFYDVNNGSLGLNLTWDDTLIEVGAIDPVVVGSIGIYGEPQLPPARLIVKCETFFDGCDLAYIKGNGNSGLYRLAFSSNLEYSKNQLSGIGNQIINVSGGWDRAAMVSGIFPAIPLNTTINSRSTFNGGVSLSGNRTFLKFTVPAGGWTTGTFQTLYCYHALTTNFNPVVRVEPYWFAPMYVQYAVENSTPGIGSPGGESPYPNQITLRVIATGAVAAGDYVLALTLHNTP